MRMFLPLAAALCLTSALASSTPTAAPSKLSACALAQADRLAPVGQLLLADGAECTATLLGPTVLLTAAHCAWRKNPRELRFSLSPPTRRYAAVKTIVIHPGFAIPRRGAATGPDLAMLQLASTEYGHSSPFYPPAVAAEAIGTGGKGWVVGYGLEEKGTFGTRRAKEVTLADAKPVTDIAGRTTANGMLRFFRGSTGENACAGDSGGPVLVEAQGLIGIVGVVSAGKLEDARSAVLASRSKKNRALFFCQHAETVEAIATAPYFDWIRENLARLETRPIVSPCDQR